MFYREFPQRLRGIDVDLQKMASEWCGERWGRADDGGAVKKRKP